MAEKVQNERVPSSFLQTLTCPLCLDIFDEATLLNSCGHTFCRKCLKKYDLSHQDLDHMVCPLCRKVTKLSANRVDDLLPDITVNGLVDDYHSKSGGANAVLEMRPKCTSCKVPGDAVSFCTACSNYMCDKCNISHEQLTSVFEGHEVVSVQDIVEGKVSISQRSERCLIHKHDKNLFCEECNVHICLMCVVIKHHNHKIKSHDDFEKELHVKVNDLIQRCADMKSEIEKNIQNVEVQRHHVHTAMQKLRTGVNEAYNVKAKRLEENQRTLIQKIDALQRDFDDDLDALKSSERQRIKSICSSVSLVAHDRLGRLEADSLSAHTLLCEELEDMLKEAIEDTSAATVTKRAQKIFQPADDTHLELGSIFEPNLRVSHCFDLRGPMSGLTKYSDDSVAIGYMSGTCNIDIIDTSGKVMKYDKVPTGYHYYDLVFQSDRKLCTTKSDNRARLFSANGSWISTVNLAANDSPAKVNKSSSNELLISNDSRNVYIFDPTGKTLKHTVPTKHSVTRQSSASAKADLIITSSCNHSDGSVVAVYDRNGNSGNPLQSSVGVYLYAAVDEQDRVYVASVDRKSDNVVIRLYDLDGLNLMETVEFGALNLTLKGDWCYLVSLSPNMLAFACSKKLYFIKVPL